MEWTPEHSVLLLSRSTQNSAASVLLLDANGNTSCPSPSSYLALDDVNNCDDCFINDVLSQSVREDLSFSSYLLWDFSCRGKFLPNATTENKEEETQRPRACTPKKKLLRRTMQYIRLTKPFAFKRFRPMTLELPITLLAFGKVMAHLNSWNRSVRMVPPSLFSLGATLPSRPFGPTRPLQTVLPHLWAEAPI